MTGVLEEYGWLLLGLVLLVAEVAVPGIFFLWLGLAAILTALATWVLPEMAWYWEVLIFGVTALALVFGVRPWVARDLERETENPALNERLRAMLGRTGVISTAIHQGVGRARIGDTEWRVAGPEMAVGTPVRVIDIRRERMLLVVEPLEGDGGD